MWVTIRDYLIGVIISGVYSFIINNWVAILAAVFGAVGGFVIAGLKKAVAFLPDEEETAVVEDIEDIKEIVNEVFDESKEDINTMIATAKEDGKISADEFKSIIKQSATCVLAKFDSETLEALSAEFGDIKDIICVWITAKIKKYTIDLVKDKYTDMLGAIEKLLAKIGIEYDLDGDGDIADVATTTDQD